MAFIQSLLESLLPTCWADLREWETQGQSELAVVYQVSAPNILPGSPKHLHRLRQSAKL